MKFKPSELQNKPASTRSFAAVKVVMWSVILPLSASIIFNGCANNKQPTIEEKAKNMAYKEASAPEIRKLQPPPKDTLPTSFMVDDRTKNLEAKRKQIVNESPLWDLPMPERGGKKLTGEEKAQLVIDMMYRLKEVAMYDAALKGDPKRVEKARQDMLDFAKSRGEEERGQEKVRTFDSLNTSESKAPQGDISKRDSMLKARLVELKGEMWSSGIEMPDREHPSHITEEKKREIMKELMYNTTEQMIYSSALKGDDETAEKYVEKLLNFSKSLGEQAKGEEIVRKFRQIMAIE